MAEHGDRLYLATDTEVLASEDNGETWHALGTHPEGISRGFVVTDAGFYLALTNGVYYSKDGRPAWVALKEGMRLKKIHALVAVENSVFAGTNSGLYRLNAQSWELLSVGPIDKHGEKPVIHALAASEHRLYVAAGGEFKRGFGALFSSKKTDDDWWSLYRSTDQGASWYPIDPWERQERETDRQRKDRQFSNTPLPGADDLPTVKIFTMGAGVMVTDANGEFFYSENTGETWTPLKGASGSGVAAALLIADTNTFYKGGASEILRTTDGGESWHPFNTGFVSTPVTTLIAAKGRLYANEPANGFVTSTDGGESWTELSRDIDQGVLIAAFDDNVYVKQGNAMNLPSPLLRLSTENNSLKFIPDMPGFEGGNSGNTGQVVLDVPKEMIIKALQEAFPDKFNQNIEDLEQATEMLKGIDPDLLSDRRVIEKIEGNPDYVKLRNEAFNKAFQEQAPAGMSSFFGSFAVSGETYYVEYGQKLFRWKPGMAEWHDTGLVDETEFAFPFDYSAEASTSMNILDSIGFKIAVSGKTVYVGKRDGRLAQSFDEGETWNDVTAELPFAVTEFKAIAFAGSTVYVATDNGVAYSSDGTDWHATTDAEGEPLVMERFAVEETTVYGTTGQYVYALKEGANTWKQVTPEIPDAVLSFAVDGNVLYVGTASSGVLRFTLEE